MSTIANHEQYDAWNGDSGARWVATADARDAVLAPIGAALMDAAAPRAGESVLDIGCGCGATTLAAARRVGPTGPATGMDLSRPMLDVARRRAGEQELANATFLQADAQTHRADTSVDLIISRFGTMFFDDPTAAFANLLDALDPDGRMVLATWQPFEANEWLVVPDAALLRFADPPTSDTSASNMFAQSDPASVAGVLTAAGFRDVELQPVTLPLVVGATIADALDFVAEGGPSRGVLERVPVDHRDLALDGLRATLERHLTETGVELGAAIWLIHARRS